MKLTGELKDKVDKTESMVEKKDIIAEAGMELTDDELESVLGGRSEATVIKCRDCGYETFVLTMVPKVCWGCRKNNPNWITI